MAVAGLIILLVKYQVLKVGFLKVGEDRYKITQPLEERMKSKKVQTSKRPQKNQETHTEETTDKQP
jgi:hypothetical protein